MSRRFNQLKNLVEDVQDDVTKFYEKGNKAAGTRVRKAMQDLKQVAQDIRVEIQDMKNNQM
ncbi:MAG: histone H1 [Rhodothermales bacterium]|nr:histone H1 [Rhodothermales bacterium]